MKKPSPELMQMLRERHWLRELLSRVKEVQGRPQTSTGLGLEKALQERKALKDKDLH